MKLVLNRLQRTDLKFLINNFGNDIINLTITNYAIVIFVNFEA